MIELFEAHGRTLPVRDARRRLRAECAGRAAYAVVAMTNDADEPAPGRDDLVLDDAFVAGASIREAEIRSVQRGAVARRAAEEDELATARAAKRAAKRPSRRRTIISLAVGLFLAAVIARSFLGSGAPAKPPTTPRTVASTSTVAPRGSVAPVR